MLGGRARTTRTETHFAYSPRIRARVARQIERVAKGVPWVSSAFAERLTGGRYIDVDIDRAAATSYGLNIADVQAMVSGAIGGETIGQTVDRKSTRLNSSH